MSLIYGDKINPATDPNFESTLDAVANTLQTDPNNLMIVFQMESGVNPAAQNTAYPVGGGYATGLMQFTPSTAASLGTTTDALKNMTATQQLQYVQAYFTPYIGKIGTFENLYLVTFFPAALGYSDDQCIGTAAISCAAVAASNPSFDLNKDGQITIAEFKQAIDAKLPLGYGTPALSGAIATTTAVLGTVVKNSYGTITYSSLTGGTFSVGSIITGSNSGATATIITDNGTDTLTFSQISGSFQTGENITNGISSATISSVSNPVSASNYALYALAIPIVILFLFIILFVVKRIWFSKK